MKGKIDKDGFLYIERAGKYILQYCPFSGSSDVTECCHWCALFGEPEIIEDITDPNGNKYNIITLELCKKILYFNEFTDKRN